GGFRPEVLYPEGDGTHDRPVLKQQIWISPPPPNWRTEDMAETVKKAKSASAKPKKAAAKKKSAAVTADPITENHHVHATEHARENGHRGEVSHDEVARLAHKFWQERGHNHGNHIEDWYRAETELRKRSS